MKRADYLPQKRIFLWLVGVFSLVSALTSTSLGAQADQVTISGTVTLDGEPVSAEVFDYTFFYSDVTDANGYYSVATEAFPQQGLEVRTLRTNGFPLIEHFVSGINGSSDVTVDVDIPHALVDLEVHVVTELGTRVDAEVALFGEGESTPTSNTFWDQSGRTVDGTASLKVLGTPAYLDVDTGEFEETLRWDGTTNPITVIVPEPTPDPLISGIVTIDGVPVQAEVSERKSRTELSTDESGQFSFTIPPTPLGDLTAAGVVPGRLFFFEKTLHSVDLTSDTTFALDIETIDLTINFVTMDGVPVAETDLDEWAEGSISFESHSHGLSWVGGQEFSGGTLTIPVVDQPADIMTHYLSAYGGGFERWDGVTNPLIVTLPVYDVPPYEAPALSTTTTTTVAPPTTTTVAPPTTSVVPRPSTTPTTTSQSATSTTVAPRVASTTTSSTSVSSQRESSTTATPEPSTTTATSTTVGPESSTTSTTAPTTSAPATSTTAVELAANDAALSISGQVFEDVDRNGQVNGEEQDVSGVDVELYEPGADGVFDTPDDVLIGTATTASPYEFEGITPGEYLLVVDQGTLPTGVYGADGRATAGVLVVEGEVASVNFAQNYVLVRSTVTTASGLPAQGADIVLTDSDGNAFRTTADHNGGFSIEGSEASPLFLGTAILQITDNGVTTELPVNLSSTFTQLPTVDLDSGSAAVGSTTAQFALVAVGSILAALFGLVLVGNGVSFALVRRKSTD